MGAENLMGSPVAVAVTAAVFSPRVRGVLHRGAVYGLAGAFIAGDALSSFVRGVGRGVQEESAADPAQDVVLSPTEAAEETEAATRAAERAEKAQESAEMASKSAAAPTAKSATRARKAAPDIKTAAETSEGD